ncbi:MAG TPA: hypothetical protein VIJ15_03390 [Dermatophilaceae bacterium]
MRTLLPVILLGAFLSVLGCGGGSGQRVDSSAGGQSAAGGGTGGALATGAGGALSTGTGGALTTGTGGALATGTGGSVTKGTGGSSAGGAGGALTNGTGGSGGNADAGAVHGNCPQTAAAPCGGNLVGTWTLKVDECIFPSSSYCPGLTYSVAPTSSYGAVYTFNANGTLSTSIAGNFIATIRYPPECLSSDAGAAQSCTDLSNSLQSIAGQLGDAGTDNIMTASYSCSADSSGTCVCNEQVAYTPRILTGTYTTSGTTITVSSLSGPGIPDAGSLDGSAASPSDYCVSGNTLTLWSTSSSGTTSPTVLTK